VKAGPSGPADPWAGGGTVFMTSAPHATPKALPQIRSGSNGGAGDELFRWDTLVSRVLHPIQLSMVEALIWIGLPISPSDLSQMYGGEFTNSHTGYHVKVLADHGIVELSGTEQVRGVTRHLYVLTPELT
jgi:hypothetical protein